MHFWLHHSVQKDDLRTLARGFCISRKGGTGGGGWGHLVGDIYMVAAVEKLWLRPGELRVSLLSGPGFSFGVRVWAEMDVWCVKGMFIVVSNEKGLKVQSSAKLLHWLTHPTSTPLFKCCKTAVSR